MTEPLSLSFAKEIRKNVLKMVYEAKASHVGGALSMADILAVLYNGVMVLDPSNPSWEKRDIFLLSKGHSCVAVYAALALKGYFPLENLDSFAQDGSFFLSHTSHKIPGVELSTGSLGHALSVGCGLALSYAIKDNNRKVYCIVSEGDLNEGSTWEAILFAPHHKLDNLIVIVDYNKIQSFGNVEDVLGLELLHDKFTSFGWDVYQINGHDHKKLYETFNLISESTSKKPSVVIADTIKGKGVDFMENQLLWHYKSPSQEQYLEAINQIEKQ